MIDTVREEILFSVQNPGQYSGGEFGSITYSEEQPLKMAISFPDLYTIGMSNQAIKIIYNLANSIEGVQCERVFSPMKDMEDILKEKNYPYFTLETGIPLKDLDLFAISLGYELGFTNLLNILDVAQIPFHNKDRVEEHPILIAGGPTVTNPIPYSDFIDFFYIGEGEAGYVELLTSLREAKEKGSSRSELMDIIKNQPFIWYDGKKEKTTIIKYAQFGREKSWTSALPVPTIETVQNHGVVEIMRGCPNKCRFCHAGVYYRPKREKDWNLIIEEADFLVNVAGYKDITLSSLSSGDFTDISQLIDVLNERYKGRDISFQLPSLRVNSLSLDLIEKISQVKKSGLTFAVEAAREDWQHGLNKDVSEEKIIEILREAKQRGWRQAKFYFMLGLPMSIDQSEEIAMIEYLNRIQRATKINLTVNIGTFIPKTFTPFQKARQLKEMDSLEKIIYIKKNINNRNIRISYHSPFASLIEAVLSRGDKRAGELFLTAYKKGARLDSWDDKLDRNLWKDLLAETDWNVEEYTCSDHEGFSQLYEDIDLLVTEESLHKENEMSFESHISDQCDEICHDHCGVCKKGLKVTKSDPIPPIPQCERTEEPGYFPYLFTMAKEGAARFVGHLDFARTVERAFYRCQFPIKMSEGFNPKPKLEFACPLSLGVSSDQEIVMAEFTKEMDTKKLIEEFNSNSPEGFSIIDASLIPFKEGQRKVTLMKHWGGSDWKVEHTTKSSDVLFDLFNGFIEDQNLQNSFKILSIKGEPLLLRHTFSREKVAYNSITKLLRVNCEDFTSYRVRRVMSWATKREKLITYKKLFGI